MRVVQHVTVQSPTERIHLIAIDCWKRLLRLPLLLCQIVVRIFACRFCRAKYIVNFHRTTKIFKSPESRVFAPGAWNCLN